MRRRYESLMDIISAMLNRKPLSIAVVGAGVAGASCARFLSLAGHAVQVFDKARGPGGRLASRRAEWVDGLARAQTTRLDHGAVCITASTSDFQAFIEQALRAGWLAAWAPALAADSLPLEGSTRLYLPVPDLPSLCRHLLEGVAAKWSFAVDALHRGPDGWQLQAGGVPHGTRFDAVLLALPPAQAAPLLSPHRPDWARHAAVAPMQPCWTLMGVADAPQDSMPPVREWALSRPPSGPLAWVVRNDARPGRQRVPGQAHWVAHARAGWSRRHLEQPAEWVQQQLQAALAEYLGEHPGERMAWQHSAVHRWRYAMPQTSGVASHAPSRWDAASGLGLCGDHLGHTAHPSSSGVEGAWLSAQSLASAVLRPATEAPSTAAECTTSEMSPYLTA
jgi:renalase